MKLGNNFFWQKMCCNNTFCNPDADIENFEARNQPKQSKDSLVFNPTASYAQRAGDRNAVIRMHSAHGGSMHSGSGTNYERGHTNLLSHPEEYSGFAAATSNQGVYEEPKVDVLANSRQAQLADALTQSAQKQQINFADNDHEYAQHVNNQSEEGDN